jgi:hypothetical protein
MWSNTPNFIVRFLRGAVTIVLSDNGTNWHAGNATYRDGHDDQGKAVVLFDGPALNMKQRKAGGNVLTMLWVTDENL